MGSKLDQTSLFKSIDFVLAKGTVSAPSIAAHPGPCMDRFKRFEVMSAVNTTPSAVAHRGALERTFVVARKNWSPTMPVTPS